MRGGVCVLKGRRRKGLVGDDVHVRDSYLNEADVQTDSRLILSMNAASPGCGWSYVRSVRVNIRDGEIELLLVSDCDPQFI